jgi:hypothetical protein
VEDGRREDVVVIGGGGEGDGVGAGAEVESGGVGVNGDESAGTSANESGAGGGAAGGAGARRRRRRGGSRGESGAGAGAGSGSGSDRSDAGAGAGAAEKEAVREVLVDFEPERKKPASTSRRSGKLDVDFLAELVTTGFYVYAQSRPSAFAQAWEFSVEDTRKVAVPLSNILNRLPSRYLKAAVNLADPVSLVVSAYALVTEGMRREREIAREVLKLVERGEISREEAVRLLGLRQSAQGAHGGGTKADDAGVSGFNGAVGKPAELF